MRSRSLTVGTHAGRAVAALVAGAALTLLAAGAQGQTVVVPDASPEPSKAGGNPSPKALEIEAERLWNKRRYEALQQLRKIRGTHFHHVKDDAKRNEGIEKMQAFRDPAAFGPMLDVMDHEGDDVLLAMIAIFDRDTGNAGEAALVAAMCELESAVARHNAQQKILVRLAKAGRLGPGASQLLDAAIRGTNDARRTRALDLIAGQNLVEFIPSLIGGQTFTKADDEPGSGDTANITIGNQLTYVSRVRPVVSEGAVAFDPEIGTLNTGTQLRVRNVSVSIRRVDVNSVLVGMADELSGQSTAAMGYDPQLWNDWYATVARDRIQRRLDARLAAAKNAPTNASQPAAPAPANPAPAPGT